MASAQRKRDLLDTVGPKLVCVRFSNWHENDSRFKEIKRQLLALMNVDRNGVTPEGRRRVDIAYLPEKKMLEFTFFYQRPAWAHRAENVAKALEQVHQNCKVTLEILEDE